MKIELGCLTISFRPRPARRFPVLPRITNGRDEEEELPVLPSIFLSFRSPSKRLPFRFGLRIEFLQLTRHVTGFPQRIDRAMPIVDETRELVEINSRERRREVKGTDPLYVRRRR